MVYCAMYLICFLCLAKVRSVFKIFAHDQTKHASKMVTWLKDVFCLCYFKTILRLSFLREMKICFQTSWITAKENTWCFCLNNINIVYISSTGAMIILQQLRIQWLFWTITSSWQIWVSLIHISMSWSSRHTPTGFIWHTTFQSLLRFFTSLVRDLATAISVIIPVIPKANTCFLCPGVIFKSSLWKMTFLNGCLWNYCIQTKKLNMLIIFQSLPQWVLRELIGYISSVVVPRRISFSFASRCSSNYNSSF